MTHHPWQENNRIVNYRKIWKDIRLEPLKWPDNHRRLEVRITSEKGVRYATVGLVDKTTIDIAVDIFLNSPFSTFMLVSDQDFNSVDATRALFDAIFPIGKHDIPKTDEDWGVLIHQRAELNDVVIKQAGKFDGLEWCLDLFGQPETLEPFVGKSKRGRS